MREPDVFGVVQAGIADDRSQFLPCRTLTLENKSKDNGRRHTRQVVLADIIEPKCSSRYTAIWLEGVWCVRHLIGQPGKLLSPLQCRPDGKGRAAFAQLCDNLWLEAIHANVEIPRVRHPATASPTADPVRALLRFSMQRPLSSVASRLIFSATAG